MNEYPPRQLEMFLTEFRKIDEKLKEAFRKNYPKVKATELDDYEKNEVIV